jgi:hypothetical protein
MAYKPGSGFAVAQWVVPTPPINPEIWCQGYCNVIELFCKVAQQLLIAGHRMCSNLLEHGTITFKFRNRLGASLSLWRHVFWFDEMSDKQIALILEQVQKGLPF